jgi:hypothetical protein
VRARNERLWNVGSPRDRRHSGLMLAARITLPHFSASSTKNFPNSVGVIDIRSPPSSVSRIFILGSVRAALISLLSLLIISTGAFLGALMPVHVLASYP